MLTSAKIKENYLLKLMSMQSFGFIRLVHKKLTVLIFLKEGGGE